MAEQFKVEDLLMDSANVQTIAADRWIAGTGGPVVDEYRARNDQAGYESHLRDFNQNRDPALRAVDQALVKVEKSEQQLQGLLTQSLRLQDQWARSFLTLPRNPTVERQYQDYWTQVAQAVKGHAEVLGGVQQALRSVPDGTPYAQARDQLNARVESAFIRLRDNLAPAVGTATRLVASVERTDRALSAGPRESMAVSKSRLGQLIERTNSRNANVERFRAETVAPGRPQLMSSDEWTKGTALPRKPRSRGLKDVDESVKNNELASKAYDALSAAHPDKLTSYMKTVGENPADARARQEYLDFRKQLTDGFEKVAETHAATRAAMTNWSRAGESSRDGSGALTQMRQSFDGASQLIENGRQQLRQGDAQIASVESVAQSMSRQQRSAAPRAQSEEVNVALDTRRSVVSELLDDYNYTRSQSLESNRASAASLASSELTRASNIVQIAYIPGVTGRGGGLDVIGGPSTSAAPGPSADRESRSVSEYSSTHSEDLYSAPPPRGPGHRTLPSDVTAATLDIGARASMLPSGSAAQEPQAPRPSSSIYSADRDSQSIRDSQVERASHRESIASNYREEAIASPLPAQTIVAGRARPVVIGSEQQQLGSSQQAPSPNAQPGLATLPATTFTPQRREARQPPEQAAAESSRAQQRQSRGESDGERSRSPSPQAQQRATRDGQRRDTQLPSRPGPGQGRNR